MGYKPIDSNETYQIDQNGKIVDSILRNVEPEVDEQGPFIHYKEDKAYVADLLKRFHGEGAAKAYMKKYEAQQATINKSGEDADGEDEPDEGKEVSTEKKIELCKEAFEKEEGATYQQVKDAVAEVGVTVNDQHVSKGKEAAGLK